MKDGGRGREGGGGMTGPSSRSIRHCRVLVIGVSSRGTLLLAHGTFNVSVECLSSWLFHNCCFSGPTGIIISHMPHLQVNNLLTFYYELRLIKRLWTHFPLGDIFF